MGPQEIIGFQEFLKNKKDYIKDKVTGAYTLQIIDLTFGILQAELDYEFEKEGKAMAKAYGEEK